MSENVEEFLAHHGVRGMKWGRRRNKTGGNHPSILSRSPKAPQHEDSRISDATRAKIAKSGLKSVSNADLKRLNERMQLEQNYSNLMGQKKSSVDKVHAYVKNAMSLASTAQQVYNLYNSPLGKAVVDQVKKQAFK